VAFDNVRVESDAVIGEPGAAMPLVDQVVDTATAALCAEAVRTMSKAHEITVGYLKVRNQFGKPIASFQALQHRAVDMLVMIEQARGMAMYAAMMVDECDPLERVKPCQPPRSRLGERASLSGNKRSSFMAALASLKNFGWDTTSAICR
jgi:alkylation response protein AidB-like acyl-CoA dehydrogenase